MTSPTPLRRIAIGPLQNGVHQWKTPHPDAESVRAIAIGPFYRANWTWDEPPTALPLHEQEESRKMLSDWWDITGPDDAKETCEHLLAGGHSKEFDLLLALGEACLTSPNPTEAGEGFGVFASHVALTHGGDPDSAKKNFDNWMRLRTNPDFARFMPPQPPTTTLAWDVMRLSVAAGRSVEVGWLSTEQYMDFARRGVAQLQENYASWRQAANGFLWGRAIWLADEIKNPKEELCQFSPVIASLLTDPESPWLRFPLQP